ncbi:hypothetical protein EJB05_19423, partial [Eragrostis curvula]
RTLDRLLRCEPDWAQLPGSLGWGARASYGGGVRKWLVVLVLNRGGLGDGAPHLPFNLLRASLSPHHPWQLGECFAITWLAGAGRGVPVGTGGRLAVASWRCQCGWI